MRSPSICGELYSEITQAHLSDINMETKQIKLCTGRVVGISDKLIDVATWAAVEDIYQSHGEQHRKYEYKESGTDLLFKTLKSGDKGEKNDLANRAQVLNRRYIKGLNAVGLTRQLTSKRLMVSGKIHYMKEMMKKEGMTLDELLATKAEEINTRYPVEKIYSNVLFGLKYRQLFESF